MAVKKILTDINVTGLGTFTGTVTAANAVGTHELVALGQLSIAAWNSHLNNTSNPHGVLYADLTDKPDLTSLHSHANKVLLDGIAAVDISNWDAAHTHSGVTIGNPHNVIYSEITGTPDLTSLHSHANKTLLDGIAPIDINNWDSAFTHSGVTTGNPHSVTLSDVGGAAASHTHVIGDVTSLQTALNAKEDKVNKGATNGYASLDGSGKVPQSQLPSYVDEVQEFANFAALPPTGASGIIYVTTDNNKTWRWSGSAYVEISASLVIGTTTGSAFDGGVGHAHVINTNNPHSTSWGNLTGSQPAPIAHTHPYIPLTGTSALAGNIIPSSNNSRSLGSDQYRFKWIYGSSLDASSGAFSGIVDAASFKTNDQTHPTYLLQANGALIDPASLGSSGNFIPLTGTAALTGDIIPTTHGVVNLGSATKKYLKIYSKKGEFKDSITGGTVLYASNEGVVPTNGAIGMLRAANVGAKNTYIDLGVWSNTSIFGTTDELPVLRAHDSAGSHFWLAGKDQSTASIINSRLQLGYAINVPNAKAETLAVNGAGVFEDVVTATSFFESSDERLKENIVHLDDTFVTYTFKKDIKKIKHYGAIAQEVEISSPELVKEGSDGFKAVDYTGLLVKELVEVKNKNRELEERLKRLEEIVFKKQ